MTEDKNKWIEAIAKLIKLTQDGKIKWFSYSEAESLKKFPDDRIESSFFCTYKEKNLRIYKRLFKRHVPEFMGKFFPLGKDGSVYSTQTILEIFDNNDQTLWSFPKESILDDLLAAVLYQVSGIKYFLDDILKEE